MPCRFGPKWPALTEIGLSTLWRFYLSPQGPRKAPTGLPWSEVASVPAGAAGNKSAAVGAALTSGDTAFSLSKRSSRVRADGLKSAKAAKPLHVLAARCAVGRAQGPITGRRYGLRLRQACLVPLRANKRFHSAFSVAHRDRAGSRSRRKALFASLGFSDQNDTESGQHEQ